MFKSTVKPYVILFVVLGLVITSSVSGYPQKQTWTPQYYSIDATGLEAHAESNLGWSGESTGKSDYNMLHGELNASASLLGGVAGGAAKNQLVYMRIPLNQLSHSGEYTFKVHVSYSVLPYSFNLGAPIVGRITAGLQGSHSMLFTQIAGKEAYPNPDPVWSCNEGCRTITNFGENFVKGLALEGLEIITGQLDMSLAAATTADFGTAIWSASHDLFDLAKKTQQKQIILTKTEHVNTSQDYLWIGGNAVVAQAGIGEGTGATTILTATVDKIEVY